MKCLNPLDLKRRIFVPNLNAGHLGLDHFKSFFGPGARKDIKIKAVQSNFSRS